MTTRLRRPLALASLAASLLLALSSTALPPLAAAQDRSYPGPAGPRYAGWATIVYPTMSDEDVRAMLWRQLSAGANVVWVGHNNPGEVDASIAEPGLSYAVYAAYVNPDDPRHADARAIVEAQLRLLRVARSLGAKVVLPIGYQLQMGTPWDEAHPDDLRRNARGDVALDTGVPNASFYSLAFRTDTRRYYEWANELLVRPYRDVILMLNLSDEPSGSDYSGWANREFIAETGYSFADVGDDPARQIELGRFQSDQIVEYATWAANQWAELQPGLPTTMSFEGATARIHLHLPHVEALFARTPPTFYPTFDAYPRDGPPEAAIDDETLTQLFMLVRSLGYYSARYQRPFWLWSSANSWGLAQASPRPGGVADAIANAYYLALLARQTGGLLEGIAVWNYNAYGQGLYNDTHRTTYDPDVMFARVSEHLPRVRDLLGGPGGATRVLVLAPDRYAYQRLGSQPGINGWEFRTYNIGRLLALARNNVASAVVGGLAGADLSGITGIVVLARAAEDLTAADREGLRAFAAAGRPVLASQALEAALGPQVSYGADPVEDRFSDTPTERDRALWQQVLGVSDPIQGYYVTAGGSALLYSIRAEQTGLRVHLPFAARGYRTDVSGAPSMALEVSDVPLQVVLESNQYAYLYSADAPAQQAARFR